MDGLVIHPQQPSSPGAVSSGSAFSPLSSSTMYDAAKDTAHVVQ